MMKQQDIAVTRVRCVPIRRHTAVRQQHGLRSELGLKGRSYWNEQVRHLALILLPSFSVFGPALLDVPNGTMNDHAGEEEGVEPWEWRVEPGDCSPRESEEEIAGVMDLAGIAI
jgi:hypothetical protein